MSIRHDLDALTFDVSGPFTAEETSGYSDSHCAVTPAKIEAAFGLSEESGLSYLSCLAIVEARRGV